MLNLRAMNARQSFFNSWWIDILLLVLVLGSLFFISLDIRPLFVPDEGRYAEISREMAASGNFITPYLNHIKYFEKPALFYWLGAAAIKTGGVNLWSIRCVNALLGLLGCLYTYFAARKLYGRSTGLLSALILGTSTLYFVMAHMVSLDLPVTVFLSISLFSFILGAEQPPGRQRRYYFWLASVAAGLAVLTKGLIGIVFPLITISAWILICGQWKLLRKSYFISCLLIFLAVTLPWHILVSLKNPEFLYFYFYEQHFLRYINPDIGHPQPAWYFIAALTAGFFPWVVFLVQGIASSLPLRWKTRSQHKTTLFLFLWAFIIFAFFSFSSSKLIPYILPVFPALAVLTARFLINHRGGRWVRLGYTILMLSSFAIAYVFYQFSHHTALPEPSLARQYLGIAASVLVIGTISSFVYIYFSYRTALGLTVATAYLFLLFFLQAAPALDTRSILPLAQTLKPILTANDEVITYNQYYQDLPFYLARRVSIVNWRNEMTYGMAHQDTREWMIDSKAFWQRWHGKKRIFVILGRDEFELIKKNHPFLNVYILGETQNNLLISNQPGNNPT